MDKVREETYKIVFSVLKNNAKSSTLLNKTSLRLSEDKALLTHLVRGILKMKMNLDYIAQQYCDSQKYLKTDIKIKIILYLGLYQLKYCSSIPDYAAIDETVALGKKLFDNKVADFINAVLREYQRNPNIDYPCNIVNRLSREHSFDEEMISTWIDLWGEEEAEQLCLFYNDNPRLSIRINQMATNKEKLINYFRKKGIEISETSLAKNILTTPQVFEVLNDVSFSEGYFSVQDVSSAMVVELLDPQADESILDLFAGPGGKCTYTSEIMQNTGEVIAVDRFPQKVKLIKQSLHRLQVTNTITIVEDALKYAPRAPAYDRVLLDVPCSGWGVLQKKPELRWQTNQDKKSLLKLQDQALTVGSYFVKTEGFLIYSTCTLNPEENEKQVEKFLEANKHFKLIDASNFISSKCIKGKYLYTYPHKHFIDGAFAAKMQKVG